MQVNSLVQGVLFFCLAVCAGYTDIKKREIPPLIWSMMALISLLNFKPVHLFGILAAFPLLIIAVWIAPGRLGGGDIKYVAAMGLVLGLQATNYAMILGLTLQILIFVIIFSYRKIKKQETKNYSLPLAPCLSVGFVGVYFMKLGGFIHAFI